MIDIRPIKQDEILAARELYAKQCPWAVDPQWSNVWARIENGKVTGFVDLQIRVLVAHLGAENARAAIELIAFIDGKLSQAGYKSYEFSVPDVNKKFQKFLKKHYGLKGEKDLPGATYIVAHET